MSMKHQALPSFTAATAAAKVLTVSAVALAVAGCSLFSSDKRKPVELEPNVALIGVKQTWAQRIGKANPTLVMNVSGNVVTMGSADGQLAAVNADTGAELWRANVGQKLSAGVGSDGKWAAVVTEGGDLVVLSQGKEQWRKRLSNRAYTAPLVAGARVFVQSADRSVSAYDAATGNPLWSQSKTGESLVLRQSGVLMAYKDTLVTGVSGRFVGIDPNNGSLRWEVPIASPRGTNDVERLVELVGGVSRVGSVLCTRAYQMAVGCIDADTAQLRWTVRAEGLNGVSGDDEVVAGADGNGVITAWARDGGSVAWTSSRLKYRKLSQPLVLGRSVIFGDGNGVVHMLSKKDGSPLNRFATNNSGISVAPVIAGNTMVVQTNDGAVYGFQPD